ncbi:ABC transporter ATP-binding protein [Adhaeretor mobilis]|uniref:Putative ABC transporter ATP-binding protein YbhF n=1 Tax=Adhaeretor mobilis TaxID=1930276 RepID=A0A517MRB4_9BACT|nr:ABC transporter ATP-binding protein [Adhaeretor mobilis]QDS97415.1 putative ABC transporter ATP-binding protein YbhF [Adhaeretor mobilis]
MLLETQSLTKRYGKISALSDCSFSAEPGEILGLLGPNGAGKTTLLRLLLGFLKPTSGSAKIGDLDCYHDSVAVHNDLTYLPGEARLSRELSGRQTLEFFTRLRAGASLERSLALADRLKLDLSRRVHKMSTGMRQKLALAATLAADVKLVILDEPTANLDPNARRDVLDLVRETRDAGRTVLFSSHVLSEVEEVCDRAILLREGRLVDTVRIADVKRQHRIQALLRGQLNLPSEKLAKQMKIETNDSGRVTILTDGDLAPLLGWLSDQAVTELQIEPVGLKTVYERYHPV